MLMILVWWILHKIQNRFFKYYLGAQLDLCTSAFFKWQMSISEATWIFMLFVLGSTNISDFFPTFVLFHAGIFSSFFHSSIPFRSFRDFHGFKHRLQCCCELSRFLVVWFGGESSTCSFVDSLVSRIYANFCFISLVFHGVTTEVSNFTSDLNGFFEFFVFRSNENYFS